MLQKIIKTDSAKTTALIRLMVGSVFLSEGIQKFLYAAQRGVGRWSLDAYFYQTLNKETD